MLGPEMRSTGEVLGHGRSRSAWPSSRRRRPPSRALPAGGHGADQPAPRRTPLALEVAREFADLGFRIRATRGHARRSWPRTASPAEPINKIHEGRPNIADAITNREIQLVVNTPAGRRSRVRRLLHPQDAPSSTRSPTSRRCRPRSPRRAASPPTATAAGESRRSRSTTRRSRADRRAPPVGAAAGAPTRLKSGLLAQNLSRKKTCAPPSEGLH